MMQARLQFAQTQKAEVKTRQSGKFRIAVHTRSTRQDKILIWPVEISS
jgi:hypothetical protein